MIVISFWKGELAFAAVWLLLRIVTWVRRGGIDWKHEALLLLMFVNLAVIIRFAFFPMALVDGQVQPLVFDPEQMLPFKINLEPFEHLDDYASKRNMALNVVGNIALFMPTGIVLPIVYKKLSSFFKVVGVGFLISLCIEIAQLPFYARTTDVDDLIFNTIGVAIGYIIYALARKLGGK